MARPVTSAWTLQCGNARVANTYLSPLIYSGWSGAVDYERWQAVSFSPQCWVSQIHGNIGLDRSKSQRGNSTMWDFTFEFDWSLMLRWSLPSVPGLTVGAGPRADLRLGALYQGRNGNNPAQAQASITADATAYTTYSLKLRRLPVTLRWQPALALLGTFFCPDYGELYYEIYVGDHSGLVHAAWPGNFRRFTSLLTADLRFGATALRVGYKADVLSTKANNIVNRRTVNMLTVGVSGEWLTLSPRHSAERAHIVSAYY